MWHRRMLIPREVLSLSMFFSVCRIDHSKAGFEGTAQATDNGVFEFCIGASTNSQFLVIRSLDDRPSTSSVLIYIPIPHLVSLFVQI